MRNSTRSTPIPGQFVQNPVVRPVGSIEIPASNRSEIPLLDGGQRVTRKHEWPTMNQLKNESSDVHGDLVRY